MISSMTGFGSADGKVGTFAVSVELRTVNHRFFNPSLKLPGGFTKWEGEVRELLRQRVARGHVSLTARIDRDAGRHAGINEERFGEYVAALRDLQSRHGLSDQLDVASILALPDVIKVGTEDIAQGTVQELLAIVDDAVVALRRMRGEEGARLSLFLLERIDLVESSLTRIAARAPARLAEQVNRMKKAVRELAGAVSVDPQRLAQEVAVMADRLDIAEELNRFAGHVVSFRESVNRGGTEPVGKRLGFLLQEMVREANTLGSKASDALILAEVVLIKEELERIREQAENIE